MSAAIKLELCWRSFDQFCQKNLQRQVGKNENQCGNPSRRLLHTGLTGPAILSADVPRVSADKQQRNSAQQMLEKMGQRANRQRWDTPPTHPQSGGASAGRMKSRWQVYESNEKGIFKRKISLKIYRACLRWLDLKEKLGNKSVGRRRN